MTRAETAEHFRANPNACRDLPFSLPPIAGESLMGFLARNANHHGIDHIAPALRPAGIDTLFPEALPTTHRHQAKDIAALLRTSEAEITLRCHPPVHVQGRPASFIDFFGTPIREHYREPRHRRFSPASLARSAHHRAAWDLKVLSFCPESKELLATACPHCGAKLGWRWTVGIAFCDHCAGDLRTISRPNAECADWEAADFVVDLVHPDPKRRAEARLLLPSDLSRLDNGEVFEATLALASALVLSPDEPSNFYKRLVRSTASFTPDALARGGRMIMEWPKSFHVWLGGSETAPFDHERPGSHKPHEPLARLFVDRYLSPAFRMEMRRQMGVSPGRLGLTKSQRDPGTPATTSRPISATARQKFEKIARMRRAKIGRNNIARLLGVDHLAVGRLADAGLFARADGEDAWAMTGEAYWRSSVQGFVEEIKTIARKRHGASLDVPLGTIVKRLPIAVVPWVGIFRALVAGDLSVSLQEDRQDISLAAALAVGEQRLRELVSRLPIETVAEPETEHVSFKEAGSMLGVTVAIIQGLVRGGLLQLDPPTAQIRTADMVAFRSDHILSGEVARLLDHVGTVRQVLMDEGLKPVAIFGRSGMALWRRNEVEAAIARYRGSRGESALSWVT